jgi:hypothetical protein
MTAQEVTALWLRLLRGGYTPLPLYGKEPPVYGKNNPRKGLPGWQTLKNITPETGVLWDVTSDYDVPLMVSRGMPSLTVLHASAQAIRNADEQDRSTYTYQFGDYDPSGVLIPKTIERRLDEMCERLDCPPPLVERIALIEEQINKHRLPTRPTKRNGNPHTAGFVGRSVELELDTLPPRVLQDLVRKVIEQRISRRATLALRVAEHSEREMLRVISRDERRRADREVAAISAKHPGCCSLCGRAFIHGSVTFIGRTSDGAMQVVSECCSRRLRVLPGDGGFLVPGFSGAAG